MVELKIKGRVWVITGPDGELIDDIDTDMIFHNSHLHITEISEMGRCAFGNLEGWRDFPERCAKGDIIIAGNNFGSGSSRQQAVDCFKALGTAAILARSFGAIYKRNAINSALAVMEVPDISSVQIKTEEVIEVDFVEGWLTCKTGKIMGRSMSEVQKEIYLRGGLFEYGRSL